ncbi:hypothetical protein ACQY0O_002191 [Thecaphora frezii]
MASDTSFTHAPFPDVTGLRTSGSGWTRIGEECEYVEAELRTAIDLREVASKTGRASDFIWSAWAAVLYHYGSHEASNVEIVDLSLDRSKPSLVALDFESHRAQDCFDAAQLLDYVDAQRREARPADQLDHGYAGLVLTDQGLAASEAAASFCNLQLQSSSQLSLVLTAFSQAHVGRRTIVLAIKASPAVHTSESATLQLQQVAALLSSLLQDGASHALSVERFDMSLRASDNRHFVELPAPDYLQDRHHDRLECEFEYFADTRPDDLALDFRFDLEDRSSVKWTYAQMNARANRVRDLLWSHGVGSASDDAGDQIVALYLEKSPETYLSFLSVVKAGAAWCPIDTDWPASRRQALLAKSSAKVVLVAGDAMSRNLQEDLRSQGMQGQRMHPIRLDQIDTVNQANGVVPRPVQGRSREQLAYMIWTSGTTGLPKGVGIQHWAIVQAMRALRQKIPYGKAAIGTDEVRYLQYSAYNFDLSIMDCFYAWGIGGTICACPRGLLLQDLVAVGTSFQPTHTLLTPAVMAMTERHAISSLKVVINGGEKLSQVVADEWSKECCLLNLYGPAEATLIAMNRRVPLGDRVKAPNIGVALPTVSCHALDKANRVVLKGTVGELVLGGPQLARGYVGDPVKTADKFFSHPQLGRVYRTGDLVRQLGNAEFEYLGRIDDQVKINGIRIELLEINAAIKNSHEEVKDSETMAFPRPGSDTELQIINISVLPHKDGSDDLLRTDPAAVAVARQLQSAAKASLPSYMLPSMFIILSRFPRTSSAKIDRIALKQVLAAFDSLDWENKLAEVEGGELADTPSSEAEECMRKWLAKLCNVAPDKIGRNTPFTSVGLDSIRAITFSQKLLQEGYKVSVVDVAEFPTLISLNKRLNSSAIQAEEKQALADDFFARFDRHFRRGVLDRFSSTPSDVRAVLPCTPLQEGMLVESQRDPVAYRIQRQYQVSSVLNLTRLRAALAQLVAEVDILRTSFVEVGSVSADTAEEWPSQPIFLQVVWSQSTPELFELQVDQQDDLEASIVAAVRKTVKLDPFSKRPPVAFMVVQRGGETYLVLVAHHSIYDARSLTILEKRIEQLYNRGEGLSRIYQFSTALAHIVPLTKQDESRRREVWERALAPYPKGELSIFPNLSGASHVPGAEDANIHRALYRTATVSWDEVERVSRQLGISARPLVQVAWAKVLGAYLDSDHVIIGDSVSGRSAAAELEQVVGPVLATLPVAVFLKGGRTVAETAKEVDAFHRSVFASQHTHIASLRKLLELPAGQPLFHSVFVFEPAADDDSDTTNVGEAALGLKRIADLAVATEHALAVEVQPNADGSIRIGVSWQRSQVSDAYGRLLLDLFDACLSAFCAEPQIQIQDCPAASEADANLFSISKKDSPATVEAAANANVAFFISASARTSAAQIPAVEIFADIADSITARAPSAAITYAELDEQSNRVASLLVGLGLPRNSVVAVCLQRSIASYVYPIAILKAGLAYLPLDETLPLDRKRLLIDDSRAACLITDAQDCKELSAAVGTVIEVRSEQHRAELASASPSPSELPTVRPDDVAFIIYTSGSTGKPKGCLLTHRNLSTAIEAFRLVYEREAPGSLEGGARFLARSAEAFDVHLLEIFLSLRVGATIVTGPRHLIHDDLAQTMAVLEVTHACVVPSLFFSKGKRVRPEQIPTLKALIIGGEALTADLCELWGSSGDEKPVVLNAYGPSEATIGTSVARVSKRSITGNIGRPFPGTRYLVLREVEEKLVPVLRGEPGELCIAGPQVALGYLNRPELRSFLHWNGQWIYRTGDLVRLSPDDEAEYLGRLDESQVKVRGARLELGEVDAALQATLADTTGRRGVTVTVLADHPAVAGPARLISFVSETTRRFNGSELTAEDVVKLDEGSKQLAHNLRRAVRAKLPQYMVPSQVVPLAFLPLSALSGKADQKALKALYQALNVARLGASGSKSVREANEEEKRIADVVIATLRLKQDAVVTPTTDLISLGLDSLSVVTLVGRLRKAGIAVDAAAIMGDPTIEAIALGRSAKQGDSLQRDRNFDTEVQKRTEMARALSSMKGKGVDKAFPCVPLQIALIAHALSESSASPRYVTTVTIDVKVRFPADVLQTAWREVLQRHEIYRTVFAEVGNELSQVVLGASSCPEVWSPPSASSLGPSALQDYHRETAKEIAATFSERPPLRLKLWQGDEGLQRITLTCSHAIYDGTSLNQLLREVEAQLQGRKVAVAGQFSTAVREITSLSEEASKEFWTAKLDGFSRTRIPTLTGMKSTSEYTESGELTVQSVHRYSDLEAAARSGGVTVHSLLVAAFCRLLADYIGDDDVTIGLVLGGRTLSVEDVDLIHGPCVTTMPLRLQEVRRSKVEALSRHAHRGINGALPFQHVSLPQLMRWMGLDQSPFEALFSYLGVRSETGPSTLVETGTLMEKDYPLAVEVSAVGERVALHVAFSTNVLPPSHAPLFLSQLDTLIGTVARIGRVQPHEEQLSVLNRDCYVPMSDSETFLSRFARQVKSDPHSTAIVFARTMNDERVTLSYEQLDSMSDTIARHLMQQPSDIVGVHLTKDGPELYAAILAVWKAGKVYLPLDPSLPRERLEYMLETVGKAPAITNKATQATLSGFDSEVLDIESLCKPADASIKLPEPGLERACYLLFTSGSTGRPKAVQISHKALSGAIYSWERMLPWSKQSRFLQLASIGFDVSLIEVCMPLALGFSIGTAPKEVLIEDLSTAINKLGITIADLPAALAGTVHPDDVRLEWLMSGGDAIDERVIQDWTGAGRILINAWGPTETTIGSSLGQVKRGGSRSNVGQVYPACSMFVLKEDSVDLALRGAVGELAVGGPQVADKYFGRDDLTAEKFVHLEDGTRVYRTGDLGRFLMDGSVECLGRIGADRQVKVNGQRVELDEISQALAIHGEVRDADVQYLKHPSMSSKQLVAFIAPHRSTSRPSSALAMREDPEAVELSSKLEQEATKRLAPYMVSLVQVGSTSFWVSDSPLCRCSLQIPTHWLVVSGCIPLTPNNKVDHKALAALFTSTDTSALSRFGSMRESALTQGAWTPIEEELRDLIAGFCSVPAKDVTKTTSFHRLGIDSITAIKLVKKLRSCGYSVSVADILSSPFISSLAEKHGGAANAPSQPDENTCRLVKRIGDRANLSEWKLSEGDEVVSALPCTPLQAGMITQTLASHGKLYFHHHAFRVKVKAETVVSAWKGLTSRLDILRTSFHLIEDEAPWVQAVHTAVEPRIVTHIEPFRETQDLETVEGQATFADEGAFAQPPHVLHVWTEGDESTFILSIHHALYDAASLPLLLDDFAMLLSGLNQGLPRRTPFYQLVPRLLPSNEDTRFWVDQLDAIDACLIRSAKKRTGSSGRGVEAEHIVSTPFQVIQQACLRHGISVQVLATLAYAKFLALETGSGDVCFGQIFGMRDVVEDGETSVGPALNTVVTRARFDDASRTAADQLQRMQKANDSGRPHRKAALHDVQRAMARSGRAGPLFDALFDFQIVGEEDDAKRASAKLQPLTVRGNEGSPQYALNVEFVQDAEKVKLVSTADSSVYESDALADALHRLAEIFAHLVEQPEASVSQLPIEGLKVPLSAGSGSGRAEEQERNSASSTLPETADGKKLAEVISSVSGVAVERIYAATRLSSLGLDSISAIRIASLARRQGLPVGVADIVAAETIEGIVELVASKTNSAKAAVSRDIDPLVSPAAREAAKSRLGVEEAMVERILPLLSGQAALVASWIETGKRFGVYSWAFKTRCALDAQRLASAWSELQRRHAILRTAFITVDNQPYQVVMKAEHSSVPVRRVSVQGGSLENAAKETIRAASAAIWDLRTPPLQLSHLMSSSSHGGDELLVLSLHHVLYDAFALELLLRDFATLYAGSGPCESATNWIEYVDHVSAHAPDSAAFWREALQHADTGVLLRQRRAHDDEAGCEVFVLHPNVLSGNKRYEARLQAQGTSLQALILAAWSHLLSSWTGAPSPLFGIYQLGRSASFDGIDRLVAPCMSVLPLALSPTEEATRSLLASARDVANQLRRRAAYEQTDLVRLFENLGWPTKQARWNTYVNVLISPSHKEGEGEGGEKAPWQPIHLGDPTQFAPRHDERSSYASTLDTLSHVEIVKMDVALDVALDGDVDGLTLAIRARGDVWSWKQADEAVGQLVELLQTALNEL